MQIDVEKVLETLYLPQGVSFAKLPEDVQKTLRRRVPHECRKGLLPVLCPLCHTKDYVKLRYFNNRHTPGKLQPRFLCTRPATCIDMEFTVPPGGGASVIAKRCLWRASLSRTLDDDGDHSQGRDEALASTHHPHGRGRGRGSHRTATDQDATAPAPSRHGQGRGSRGRGTATEEAIARPLYRGGHGKGRGKSRGSASLRTLSTETAPYPPSPPSSSRDQRQNSSHYSHEVSSVPSSPTRASSSSSSDDLTVRPKIQPPNPMWGHTQPRRRCSRRTVAPQDVTPFPSNSSPEFSVASMNVTGLPFHSGDLANLPHRSRTRRKKQGAPMEVDVVGNEDGRESLAQMPLREDSDEPQPEFKEEEGKNDTGRIKWVTSKMRDLELMENVKQDLNPDHPFYNKPMNLRNLRRLGPPCVVTVRPQLPKDG